MLNVIIAIAMAVFAAVLGWFIAAQFVDRIFAKLGIAGALALAMFLACEFVSPWGIAIPILVWGAAAIVAGKGVFCIDPRVTAVLLIVEDCLFAVPFWRGIYTYMLFRRRLWLP